MDLYETLGVDETADDETIKRSYREKVKAAHPDVGGDADTFRDLAIAYEVLSDSLKRHQYDKTGNADPKRADAAYNLAVEIFFSAIETEPASVKSAMGKIVNERLVSVAGAIGGAMDDIRKYEKMHARITTAPENDFLGHAIGQQIRVANDRLAMAEALKADLEKAGELLKGYVFEEVEKEASFIKGMISMTIDGKLSEAEATGTMWKG